METKDTEVEELVKDFHDRFPSRNPDVEPKITDWLRTTLHHQLQKARHDWLQEEIVRLEGKKMMIDYTDTKVTALDRNKYYRLKGYEQGSNKSLQTIIDRYHSELDQDKK